MVSAQRSLLLPVCTGLGWGPLLQQEGTGTGTGTGMGGLQEGWAGEAQHRMVTHGELDAAWVRAGTAVNFYVSPHWSLLTEPPSAVLVAHLNLPSPLAALAPQ